MEAVLSRLPEVLLPWYAKNHRQLPWREDKDPYHVWLSEIMLQQTRVEAVKGYYSRFLHALPDIRSLASCEDDTLHKLWEGLGYYSRVRNLKKAACVIMEQHDGRFPAQYEAVRSLPGIGDYTAGAICSICYDMPTPAVDGNVLRLVSRLADDATPIDTPACKKQVQQALAAIYPPQAGDFTQALMELGATVCGPNRKPDCSNCPCRDFCLGYLRKTADTLPVKQAKKARREESKTVLLLRCQGRFALQKRPDTGLLAGLWQLPELPGIWEADALAGGLEAMGLKLKEIYRQTDRTHIFTHIQWNMRGFFLEVSELSDRLHWLTGEQIRAQAALPTAYRQFWELWGREMEAD